MGFSREFILHPSPSSFTLVLLFSSFTSSITYLKLHIYEILIQIFNQISFALHSDTIKFMFNFNKNNK